MAESSLPNPVDISKIENFLAACKTMFWEEKVRYATEQMKIMTQDEIVEVMKRVPSLFRYVPAEMRNLACVAGTACITMSECFQWVGPDLKASKSFVLHCLNESQKKESWVIAQHADRSVLDDEEVVMAIVGKCGWCLRYLDKKWCANRSVVLEAVSNFGAALQYVDEKLMDAEVVKAAVKNNNWAIFYAPEELRKKSLHTL